MPKTSKIPTIHDCNLINYMLHVVKYLSDERGNCSIESVMRTYSASVFGGKPLEFATILYLCLKTNFLTCRKGFITITNQGKEFCSLNIEQSFEISSHQKTYFINNFIFTGVWKENVKRLFILFSPNYEKFTFEYSNYENPLPISLQPIFKLLKNLGVVKVNDDYICVQPLYIRQVRDLLARRLMTQKELNNLLEADEELGLQAEELVVKYEKDRLRKLSRFPEANLVKKISQLDVSAGYDIISFDGENPGIIHDRFIEVKASRQGEVRFHWSINQYNQARLLGLKYWIYFIGNLSGNQQIDVMPIMIQNPVQKMDTFSELTIRPSGFIVERK